MNTEPWWRDSSRVAPVDLAVNFHSTIEGQHETILIYCFLDWDTRQDYYVLVPSGIRDDLEGRELDKAVYNAQRIYWGLLSPSVRIIVLDKKLRLRVASSNPADFIEFPMQGINALVSYTAIVLFAWPRLEDIPEFAHLPTTKRSQLTEIDRLARRVDMMEDASRNGERIVVKWLLARPHQVWREMHTVQSIPPHPHIVPLHSIVIEENCGRIVGWASKCVDGSDLQSDKSQFKMKWLKQITDTVDYLHLELGILHTDLQLKNIMVDKAADKILLIDFENATEINETQMQWEFNLFTWALYEIVTHDSALFAQTKFDSKQLEEDPDAFDACDPTEINEMSEWPVRTNLDCTSQEIRQYLRDWIQRRTAAPLTMPENPVKICAGWLPERDPESRADLEARKIRFEEIKERQRELQEEKLSLALGPVQWGRPDYATAYPDRAAKAINPSASEQSKPSERDVLSDVTKAKNRLSTYFEEEEPQPKRAKNSVTAAVSEANTASTEKPAESGVKESPAF
ncbi:hypothetical protein NUW58_g690 [Xylaria curta]|uniref:Uncharacterized protein n=1 Tax=Xylaria curta TaxID=42375 RepID=A0ACC1PPN9_9PEZI|nr:hypothetical protein NUW58_g690 [Xylaria curta]